MDRGLRLAVEKLGTRYALAKALGVNTSTVLRWERIPYSQLLATEKLTGIDRSILRPELFAGWRRIEK